MISRSVCVVMWMSLAGCVGVTEPPAAPTPEAPSEVTPAPGDEPSEAASNVHIVDSLLTVAGLARCNECAMKTRVIVRDQPGIKKVKINLKTGQILIYHDENLVTGQEIADALSAQEWPTTLESSVEHVPEPPVGQGPFRKSYDKAPVKKESVDLEGSENRGSATSGGSNR